MEDSSTLVTPHPKEVANESIFSLVVQDESFFSDIGSLPNIRGFILAHAPELRNFLTEQWQKTVTGSALPMVVNILINPNIFFSHRDALRGQYHTYFCPIYLDPSAIRIDEDIDDDDSDASAIVHCHREFDRHYSEPLYDRATFLSLNDIEASLYGDGLRAPFPSSNTIVSIASASGHLADAAYTIDADGDCAFKDELFAMARRSGLSRPLECLHAYLDMVTGHGGSYHHVTVGSRQTWLGRLYLAFRNGQADSNNKQWSACVKAFALETVTQLASAGMLIRNKNIIEMLADLRKVLNSTQSFRTLHWRTIRQFAESAAAEKRKQLPSHDEMKLGLPLFAGLAVHRLTGVHRHITRAQCAVCQARTSDDDLLRHAVKNCPLAGEAFLSDVLRLVDGAFEQLTSESKEFIAHSLIFGIIADTNLPHVVAAYCERQGLSTDWRDVCGSDEHFEGLPPELVPYIRTLVLMTGRPAMVASNVERLELRVAGPPRLDPEIRANELFIKVQYPVTGFLSGNDEQVLRNPKVPSELDQNRARLLLYFGLQVFDDFQMCIATASGDGLHTSKTDGWKGAPVWADGSVTYAFQISI